ncbi:hypothetical protein MNBD_ALPHA09-1152, partial [hydrothermal vent metagenome]
DLAFRFGRTLERATARKWVVSITADAGGKTLREERDEVTDKREKDAAAHPVVQAVMDRFPGARIVDIREPDTSDAATMDGTDAAKKA